jgi:hypothetical protein
VDDRLFYLGSKNAYPAMLQDDGYFVEDAAAVAHLHDVFLNKQWQYSQGTATYDPGTPKPPTVMEIDAAHGVFDGWVLKVLAVTKSGGAFTVQMTVDNNEVLVCTAASGLTCPLRQAFIRPGQKVLVTDDATNAQTVIEFDRSGTTLLPTPV